MEIPFSEEALCSLWAAGLSALTDLKTTSGQSIHIHSPGKRNSHAGPDFSDAEIAIGDYRWAGTVEIHLRSSAWIEHGHSRDKSYSNVILHVVYIHDQPDIDLPTLELKSHVTVDLIKRHHALVIRKGWISCERRIGLASLEKIETEKRLQLQNRFAERSVEIYNLLEKYTGDWETVFYLLLARNFGFQTNAMPFEWMAVKTPLNLVRRYTGNSMEMEALFFGQSGLLPIRAQRNPYVAELIERYKWLTIKHHLTGIDGHSWKFLRMRPSNFPTIRISQFADFLTIHNEFTFTLSQDPDIPFYRKFLQCRASDYWNNHFMFGTKSSSGVKKLGNASIDRLVINVIVPFLYAYGKKRGRETLCRSAVEMLSLLPPESDSNIRNWKRIGVDVKSSADTQALHQLKSRRCNAKKCLHCNIGKSLMLLAND